MFTSVNLNSIYIVFIEFQSSNGSYLFKKYLTLLKQIIIICYHPILALTTILKKINQCISLSKLMHIICFTVMSI